MVPDANERQVDAMFELFETALHCHHLRVPPTRSKADRERRRCLEKADELKWDAISMWVQHLPADKDLSHEQRSALIDKLNAAAEAYRQFASMIEQAQPDMPERDRNIRARQVALKIGNKFNVLFGSPMYGLTAKITAVVLNRPIDPEAVRHWLTKPSGGSSRQFVPCS
jgi:hypothetical protein